MAEAVIRAQKPNPPPKPGSTTPVSGVNDSAIGYPSPGKIADIRSKYIQQLRELHALFEMGALTILTRNYAPFNYKSPHTFC